MLDTMSWIHVHSSSAHGFRVQGLGLSSCGKSFGKVGCVSDG